MEDRMGENGQQAAPEVGMRNSVGAEGTSIPQFFMSISKPSGSTQVWSPGWEHPDLSGAAQRGEG